MKQARAGQAGHLQPPKTEFAQVVSESRVGTFAAFPLFTDAARVWTRGRWQTFIQNMKTAGVGLARRLEMMVIVPFVSTPD